jgi:hypothetical protein
MWKDTYLVLSGVADEACRRYVLGNYTFVSAEKQFRNIYLISVIK